MTVKRSLFRSAGVIGLATALSRVLGFARDVLLAGLFGTSFQAQAFVVAFRLPNLFRELVAEGAVTSAFVPMLSGVRQRGDEEDFWRLSQALFWRMALLLVIIGAAGWWAAPWLVSLIAPGFVPDEALYGLTVRLTRILFPFITLVGMWAYFMGLLNSLHRFAAPALGPAILNSAMILACVFAVPRVEPGILAVAVAVMIGGLIQVLVQVPLAWRSGFRPRLRWRHPETGRTLRLLGPRIVGAAGYQANVFVHTMLASLSGIVGVGAVAALYYANRLAHLPLALFGTSTAQASLPSLSEFAARGEWDRYHSTLTRVMRAVLALMIPASVGLIVLGGPIVRGLFERGAFDAESSRMTVAALFYYALGLWAYAMGKVLTSAFYAMHDTWTPVRISLETVAVNLALSAALMFPMQIAGLALASSLANLWSVWRLMRAQDRALGKTIGRDLLRPASRLLLASAGMGAAAHAAWGLASPLAAPLALALVIPAAGVIYALLCRLLRVEELDWLVQRWRRR